MPEALPPSLIDSIDAASQPEVEQWWGMLPDAARRDFVGMWDARALERACQWV